MTANVSARRRRDIIDALRRGAVPSNGLDVLAVGLDRFTTALDDDLARVAAGGSVFKAVRGEYGAGKTFFTRWLAERAKRRGFRHRRGADLGDRDPAAPAGDRLPSAHRAPVHRAVPPQCAAAHPRRLVLRAGGGRARRWHRLRRRRDRARRGRRGAAGTTAGRHHPQRPGLRRRATRLPGSHRRRRPRHRGRAGGLARRPAARGGRRPTCAPASKATSTTSVR